MKVPGIGASLAEVLISELSVNTVDELTLLKLEDLQGIKGMGRERAEALLEHVRDMETEECGFCGKKVSGFEVINSMTGDHFCSKDCRDKWESKRMDSVFMDNDEHATEKVVCDFCGNIPDSSEVIRNGNLFCSTECFERWKFREDRVAVGCEYCGREFTRLKALAEMRKHHFCTYRCRDMWETRNDILVLHCEYCDREFTRKKGLADRSEHQFCSYECKKRWPIRDELVTVACEYCGDDFKRKRILIDRSEEQLCSYGCKKSWEEQAITLTCDICGKDFSRKRKFVEQYEVQFCSYNCMDGRKKH